MRNLKHKHDFQYGQTFAITSVGDIEYLKDRCCLDEKCNKYQLWFSKRWRDSIPGLSLDGEDDLFHENADDDTEHTKEDNL